MKHVKKKYVQAAKLSKDVINVLDSAPVDEAKMSELKRTNFADHFALVLTDGDYLIQAFKYNKADAVLFIPEANPIVIYFETARFNCKNVEKGKRLLFEEIGQIGKTLNNFYTFYANASIVSTFLFNSVEAFVNSIIPHDYIYKRILDKKTESFNRLQIQASIPFEEKVKNIVPAIKKKSFHIEHGHKYESIKKLKEFRDEIMHTKSDNGAPQQFYQNLYTTALNFNYQDTLLHVRDFLNYYENNLIEECGCGQTGAD
jgi:hypothetical protein